MQLKTETEINLYRVTEREILCNFIYLKEIKNQEILLENCKA